MTELTQKQLKELLRYESKSGHFYWRHSQGRAKAGQQAGALDAYGYVVIRVNGALYKAHRLAWLYVHGQFPDGLLDHINRKPHDNRISNLRNVSQSINMHNAKARVGSRSKVPGVRWRADRNKWAASIRIGYTQHYLGTFESLEKAIKARKQAEQKMLSAVQEK
jgi:hypothetical protein